MLSLQSLPEQGGGSIDPTQDAHKFNNYQQQQETNSYPTDHNQGL
jgi:hypothetical protein